MTNNILKMLLITAAVSILSACAGSGGLTTATCFSSDCQSPENRNANTLKFGANSIHSSLNQYSSGMLHAD